MRYLTKEWYMTMQDTGLGVMLQPDDRAETYSEPYFRALFREQQNKWLESRKEICPILEIDFDPEAERRTFRRMYRSEKMRYARRLPPEILREVADLRVLALGRAGDSVCRKIRDHAASCKSRVDQTMRECFDDARRHLGETDASLLETFHFHDERVLSFRKRGRDYRLSFYCDGDRDCQVMKIRFVNAVIQKQEKRLHGAWWLYEELYKTDSGYEVHVLLDRNGRTDLTELILTCDDVLLL